MKVLVTAASKYGSTTEIAAAIAGKLWDRGLEVVEREPDDVDAVGGFDAVVLGSAVYAGHWLAPASDLVDRAGRRLAERPVWLFSSGPIGEPLRPDEDPVDVDELVRATRAHEHRVFAGRLERKRLSLPERAMVIALRVKDGDFRDWDEIAVWAGRIADALDERDTGTADTPS